MDSGARTPAFAIGAFAAVIAGSLALTACVPGRPDDASATIESEARRGRVCGDGICHRRESCSACPDDCGFCPAPPPDAGVAPDAVSSSADASEPAADAGTVEPAPLPADAGALAVIDCRDPATWPEDWTDLEDELLQLVNERRALGGTCGSAIYPSTGPVVMDPALREAARCHSLDMAVNDYFSHDSLDGRSPWDRMAEAGYTGTAYAENVAAGFSSPSSVLSGWLSSPGHCANIMNPTVNEIGVGFGFDRDSSFRNYWTQTFGIR
jgi:uncharacterized protein YkwD